MRGGHTSEVGSFWDGGVFWYYNDIIYYEQKFTRVQHFVKGMTGCWLRVAKMQLIGLGVHKNNQVPTWSQSLATVSSLHSMLHTVP